MKEKKVMVFGVFDGLHEGHNFFIREAQKLSHTLIIVIARDSEVLKHKNHLPQYSEIERLKSVQGKYPNTEVALGDEKENSWEVIKKHKPDIVALGYDQTLLKESLEQARSTFDLPIEIITLPAYCGNKLHSSILHKDKK